MSAAPAVVRAGFRFDRAGRRAAVLAWGVTLVVALVCAWPAWHWWSGALAYAPAGDSLIARIDLVVLKELVQFDRASAFGMAGAGLFAGLALALLVNPLLAGGVIALLSSSDPARHATRFFERGVMFYGRFLRALVYAGLVGAAVLGLTSAGFGLTIDALSTRGYERATIALTVLHAAVLVAGMAFFTAALDLARLRLALADSRRVLSAVSEALAFAARHLGALARVGLAYVGLLAAASALVVALRAALPGGGWGWLVLAVALQQALAYSRLRLRVATLASELALVRAHGHGGTAARAVTPTGAVPEHGAGDEIPAFPAGPAAPPGVARAWHDAGDIVC